MSELMKRFEILCTGKKNTKLNIFNTVVNPGESISLALPLPEILGYAPFYMPVKIIHGKLAGPCLLVFATMRGNEFNGMEIIKRLMKLSTLKKIKGTIIAVPVFNVYGMLNRSKFLPGEGLLEECFPGKESGDYGSRLANLFVREVFSKCDCCVEFCSGRLNYNSLPHVHTDLTYGLNKELAQSFQVPIVTDLKPQSGSIQYEAAQRDKPMLVYQAGEAMRFDYKAINLGVRSTMSLIRKLNMLSTSKNTKESKKTQPVVSTKGDWIYTPQSGLATNYKNLGDKVACGEMISKISEPLGNAQEIIVKAPYEGFITSLNEMPLVYEGEALFKIATFEKDEQIEASVQNWSENQDGTSNSTENESL